MSSTKSSDVARLAGVSRATVSNVLNGTKYVSPDLTERVQTAVKQLNYHSHGIARSLAVHKTYTVGVVVPVIATAFYPTIIAAAETVLSKHGYSLILCNSEERQDREEKNLQTIMERRVDGLLWVPCGEKNLPLARSIAGSGIPIVIVDRRLSAPEFNTVVSDNYNAGRMAARYLLDHGRTRPAIVNFLQNQAPARDRLKGFSDELRDNDVELADEHVCIVPPPEYQNARSRISTMFKPGNMPDAVFACSEALTLASLHGVRAAGVRIPEDVALLGLDDSSWSELISPPITVITQDRHEMGCTAVRLLLKEMEKGNGEDLETVELPVGIVQRQSCGESITPRTGL
jgi:LacI family transcriptional regulator